MDYSKNPKIKFKPQPRKNSQKPYTTASWQHNPPTDAHFVSNEALLQKPHTPSSHLRMHTHALPLLARGPRWPGRLAAVPPGGRRTAVTAITAATKPALSAAFPPLPATTFPRPIARPIAGPVPGSPPAAVRPVLRVFPLLGLLGLLGRPLLALCKAHLGVQLRLQLVQGHLLLVQLLAGALNLVRQGLGVRAAGLELLQLPPQLLNLLLEGLLLGGLIPDHFTMLQLKLLFDIVNALLLQHLLTGPGSTKGVTLPGLGAVLASITGSRRLHGLSTRCEVEFGAGSCTIAAGGRRLILHIALAPAVLFSCTRFTTKAKAAASPPSSRCF
mmetsp:Transcript_26282/g.57368  ORF Transcript_26282/g.57368 Transcript_26282/m.57368 type:complete len:329 (-) Transcript_26282:778-1764(-)